MFGINYFFGKEKVNTIVKSTETKCKACPETVIVENGNLSAAVEKVYSSSVMVKTYKGTKLIGSGSGFVYKIDEKYNYLITNHHVVKSGDSFKIVNYDDKEIDAKLLGSDEYLDIAILQIEKHDDMPAVAIGKSTELKLGDTAFTVGTPLGYEYHNTVTSGIISGLNREVEVSLSSNYSKEDYVMEAIQTNAAVNMIPGINSFILFFFIFMSFLFCLTAVSKISEDIKNYKKRSFTSMIRFVTLCFLIPATISPDTIISVFIEKTDLFRLSRK